MRMLTVTTLLVLTPAAASAQDLDRTIAALQSRLPEAAVAPVVSLVGEAVDRGIPAAAIADLALLGSARGRPADAIVEAARRLAVDLATARGALEAVGRRPDAGEIRAAAMALRNGVGVETIRELAGRTPAAQSAEVPLSVLSGLAGAGLPVQRALDAVRYGRAAAAPGGGPPPWAILGGQGPPFGLPPGVPPNVGTPGDRPVPPRGPPFDPPGGRH